MSRRPEGSVELVAEAAPPAHHDLLEERILAQDDGLAQVDAQVLEGDREQMAGVHVSECLRRCAVGRSAPIRFRYWCNACSSTPLHNSILEFFFCFTTQGAVKQNLDFAGAPSEAAVRKRLPERRSSMRTRQRG